MKGVAQTILLLLYVSALQRWLLGIAVVLALFGIAGQAAGWHSAAQPLFALAVLITVIAPVVADGILFRSISMPRSLWLIPYGRLKLAAGAFCSQLLLAAFVAITVGAMLSSRTALHLPPAADSISRHLATVFTLTFGGLTVYFLTLYWIIRIRLGGLIVPAYFIAQLLLSRAFPHLHPMALLTTPKGQGFLVTGCLLAWAVFAAIYVSAPRPSPPSAAVNLTRTQAQYSRRMATRMLLTGIVSRRQLLAIVTVFACMTFIVVVSLVTGSRTPGADAVMPAFIVCLFAGLFPAVQTGMMTGRARFLWLTAGLGRAELFAAVEAQSWRGVFIITVVSLALAIPPLALSIHSRPENLRFVAMLAMPFASGAALVYLSLMLIKGRKRLDNVIYLGGCTAVLAAEFACAIWESLSPALPALIGLQIVLVPLLRHVAQQRWQSIDWLIMRPLPQAPKLV